MAKSLPPDGKALPRARARSTLDRLASFRFTYVAIFAFVVLSMFSIQGAEKLLRVHFQRSVAAAVDVPVSSRAIRQIGARVDDAVRQSPWVRIAGVRVTAIVIGADGHTPLYVGGATLQGVSPVDSLGDYSAAERLLPASSAVVVSVPHDSLLASGLVIFWGALLAETLFVANRRLARREQARLKAALAEREEAATRAQRIEQELAAVRERLAARASDDSAAVEIRRLREERKRLQEKLEGLSRRESDLARRLGAAGDLEQERHALEELLDEALQDLGQKDQAIASLETRLQRAARTPSPARRDREADQWARRLRTLYKNLEIDDRALSDLVNLRDETMKLRAEESLKRLSDDADTATVRRKVGGLPPHLSIFELGFAGKGRMYYTRGRQRRFRILAVGAKNTQKTDLEYLSRLPREA